MSKNVTNATANGWAGAYLKFLKSRDENLFLKVAPLLIVFGSPEVVVSNLLPIVGESLDIGTFGLSALVLYRTFRAVRKYR